MYSGRWGALDTEVERIKEAVVTIIKSYRSLYLLTDRDVKINEMERREGEILVKGEYSYSSTLLERSEDGTFEIILDNQLKPVKVTINPSPR